MQPVPQELIDIGGRTLGMRTHVAMLLVLFNTHPQPCVDRSKVAGYVDPETTLSRPIGGSPGADES